MRLGVHQRLSCQGLEDQGLCRRIVAPDSARPAFGHMALPQDSAYDELLADSLISTMTIAAVRVLREGCVLVDNLAALLNGALVNADRHVPVDRHSAHPSAHTEVLSQAAGVVRHGLRCRMQPKDCPHG